MSRTARRSAGLVLALTAGLAYAGCSANGSNDIPARPTSSDAGSNDAGAAGSINRVPGAGGKSGINTEPNDAGSAGEMSEACAAAVTKAEVVPLDLYIMMDVSGSMSVDTGNGVTKWEAVKSALEAFIKDDASKGLGIGIQYFPLLKPNIPTSCTTDAECDSAAPCAQHLCANRLPTPVVCNTNSDCEAGLFGGVPRCIPYAVCSKATNYACTQVGTTSDCNDENNQPIGTCNLVTDLAEMHKVGLGFCEHVDKCDAASYNMPAREIGTVPDSTAALLASLDAQIPAGGTPTAPALTGVIKHASEWATAHPERQVLAVLATDGLPSECSPTTIADLAKIASNGRASTPSIKTFVIGVFGQTDVGAGAGKNLDKLANAGGTGSAFIVYTTDDVTSQFVGVLNNIRGGRLACDFSVPQPTLGQVLDYSKVNVNFKFNSKSSTLFYVGSEEDCDPLSGGWYYDTDPATTAPLRIQVCEKTCDAFKSATGASLDIAIGCQTLVK